MPARYCFGPYTLLPAERLLLRSDEPVPLTAKAFATLVFLVERAGHVVEKRELLAAVWGDTNVEEATLTQNVSTVRKALGDRGDIAQYIETVPRVGYRFIAAVVTSEDVSPPVPAVQTHAQPQPRVTWRAALAAAAALLVL